MKWMFLPLVFAFAMATFSVSQASQTVQPIKDVPSQLFDKKTGKPLCYYVKYTDGSVELFSQPGFHPRYQVQLKPITKEVAEQFLRAKTKKLGYSENVPQSKRDRTMKSVLVSLLFMVAVLVILAFFVKNAMKILLNASFIVCSITAFLALTMVLLRPQILFFQCISTVSLVALVLPGVFVSKGGNRIFYIVCLCSALIFPFIWLLKIIHH